MKKKMGEKRDRSIWKATALALALTQTLFLMPVSTMSVHAEDGEFKVVIEDEVYYEDDWNFDDWYDEKLTPVKTGRREVTGKVGENVRVTPLDDYELVHIDEDETGNGYNPWDAIKSQGYFELSSAKPGYEIGCILVYVTDGGSESAPREKKTSDYEKGLKYAEREKTVITYSTLTNPGKDANGHGLIYSTFVKEIPKQIVSAPENATLTFGNPTYNTLPGTVMESLLERPDVTLVFEFNHDGEVKRIRIPVGQADTNGYEYYGPALLLDLYEE